MRGIVSLKKNNDFRRMYERGKVSVSSLLVTYVRRNQKGQTRVGITTSKKTGNAVKRNRARRIIREAYREILPSLNGKWDIVFVSRGRTCLSQTSDIVRVMKSHFERLGIITRKEDTR